MTKESRNKNELKNTNHPMMIRAVSNPAKGRSCFSIGVPSFFSGVVSPMFCSAVCTALSYLAQNHIPFHKKMAAYLAKGLSAQRCFPKISATEPGGYERLEALKDQLWEMIGKESISDTMVMKAVLSI